MAKEQENIDSQNQSQEGEEFKREEEAKDTEETTETEDGKILQDITKDRFSSLLPLKRQSSDISPSSTSDPSIIANRQKFAKVNLSSKKRKVDSFRASFSKLKKNISELSSNESSFSNPSKKNSSTFSFSSNTTIEQSEEMEEKEQTEEQDKSLPLEVEVDYEYSFEEKEDNWGYSEPSSPSKILTEARSILYSLKRNTTATSSSQSYTDPDYMSSQDFKSSQDTKNNEENDDLQQSRDHDHKHCQGHNHGHHRNIQNDIDMNHEIEIGNQIDHEIELERANQVEPLRVGLKRSNTEIGSFQVPPGDEGERLCSWNELATLQDNQYDKQEGVTDFVNQMYEGDVKLSIDWDRLKKVADFQKQKKEIEVKY